MQLKRLVVEFRGDDEYVVRALYSTSEAGEVGPHPGTKARSRLVADLVRGGLKGALEALAEPSNVVVVGTSGFAQREDILAVDTAKLERSTT
jgi:hypothetical protein